MKIVKIVEKSEFSTINNYYSSVEELIKCNPKIDSSLIFVGNSFKLRNEFSVSEIDVGEGNKFFDVSFIKTSFPQKDEVLFDGSNEECKLFAENLILNKFKQSPVWNKVWEGCFIHKITNYRSIGIRHIFMIKNNTMLFPEKDKSSGNIIYFERNV